VTPQELAKTAARLLTQPPPIPARDALGRVLRGESRVLSLRYEWIKDWRGMQELTDQVDVGLWDGQEWVHLFIVGQ
jgi:hypothetical protein